MSKFSKISRKRLDECDPRLIKICEAVFPVFDISVICGYRSNEDQEKAFKAGRSKLRAGQSKHNHKPSLAVDIAPYPAPVDIKEFYFMAGIVKAVAHQQGVKIRWGGDWDGDGDFTDNSFNDLYHFEIVL
jgi:peptidoglycan LD-endopeptidase CwlK